MEKQQLSIEGIPAVLWGPAADRLFLAVHGDQSHKEDEVMALFAEEAVARGYQVLSADLPGHGARKSESRACNPPNAVEELARLMEYARGMAGAVSLFACSLGAYFSMLAFGNEPLRQALFLSPVVDMQALIEKMMAWFDVSAERLEREKTIPTPMKTLEWNYYQYVLNHPVGWRTPTALLCGGEDELNGPEIALAFAARTGADATVQEGSGHYFHTETQLAFFRKWLQDNII